MPDNAMNKAALHKRLTTQPTDERIELMLQVLAASPGRLKKLIAGRSEAELMAPLGEGERSFKRDLTHLIYCVERGTDSIYHALILKEPFIPRIHAERDWGALMGYDAFDIPELMAYFSFRRVALLRILHGLKRPQWDRSARREGVKRSQSVYHWARGLCLHEYGHLEDLAKKLGAPC